MVGPLLGGLKGLVGDDGGEAAGGDCSGGAGMRDIVMEDKPCVPLEINPGGVGLVFLFALNLGLWLPLNGLDVVWKDDGTVLGGAIF